MGTDVHQDYQAKPDPVKSDDPTREYHDVLERRPGQEDDAQDHPDDEHTQYGLEPTLSISNSFHKLPPGLFVFINKKPVILTVRLYKTP